MYQLEKIEKKDFGQIWDIMEKSFPADERRTKEEQENLLLKPEYGLVGCRDRGRWISFFGLWYFDTFVFIEHFAVKEEARNGGLGVAMLDMLKKEEKRGMILEVEPPEDELKCRRIRFYERNGFVLNDYAYKQPPITAGTNEIPLKIMSLPGALEEEQFLDVRRQLYRVVYGIEQ